MNSRKCFRVAAVESLENRRLLALNTFGVETNVTPATDAALVTSSAVGGNGIYVVAQQEQHKNTLSVVAARYSPSGQRIGAIATLATFPANQNLIFLSHISTSMDPAGDAVVAYGIGEGATLASGIYFTRISKAGVVSAPTLVSKTNVVDGPSVSMDTSGRCFMAWVRSAISSDNGSPEEQLEVRAYNANGTARAAEFTASKQDFGRNVLDVTIASRPDGAGAVYGYTFDDTEDAIEQVIYGRTTTTALKGHDNVVGDSASSAPSIDVHADGSFLIAYDTSTNGGETFIAKFDSSGGFIGVGDPNAKGNPIELGDTTIGFFTHSVALAPMPDSGFVATFGVQTQTTDTLYACRFNAAGTADASGNVLLATAPQFSDTFIGSDASGNIVASFLSNANLAKPGFAKMHYRRLTTNLAAVDSAVLYVFGTESADAIGVKTKSSHVLVNLGETIKTFTASGVKALSIVGLGGNDSIGNYTALPSTINGGNGNDTVRGGSSSDLLIGAKGKDKLYGYGGDDSFSIKDIGRDTVDGGDGMDAVLSKDSVDVLRNIP